MINRDSWGHSYLTVRGEILGFVKDGLLRKYLPGMLSLIKNENYGIETVLPTVRGAFGLALREKGVPDAKCGIQNLSLIHI